MKVAQFRSLAERYMRLNTKPEMTFIKVLVFSVIAAHTSIKGEDTEHNRETGIRVHTVV